LQLEASARPLEGPLDVPAQVANVLPEPALGPPPRLQSLAGPIEIGGVTLYGAAMVLKRRNLIYLAVADALLFLLANVTSKSSSHPGTTSNVFWYAFLVGVVLLVVLGLVALIQSRRT
jgi:hypothetical protein